MTAGHHVTLDYFDESMSKGIHKKWLEMSKYKIIFIYAFKGQIEFGITKR